MGLPTERKISSTGGAFCSTFVIGAFHSPQRLHKAELVAVWVGHVKEALAPFRIARRRVRAVTGRDHLRMKRVDVGLIEDDTPPPGPVSLGGLRDQIEIAGAWAKAGEGGAVAAVNHLESEHAIETDGARHVVGRQRHGTDAFNHQVTLWEIDSCG